MNVFILIYSTNVNDGDFIYLYLYLIHKYTLKIDTFVYRITLARLDMRFLYI